MAARIKLADEPNRYYGGADVPMRAIRKFAREVAERYKPDKIVLFGSYAYGTPNVDSDVDILVVMPCRNELDCSVRICLNFEAPFPLDLIVRTPEKLKKRLELGDSFLIDVIEHGVVMYEKADRRMGSQSRSRSVTRRARVRSKTAAE